MATTRVPLDPQGVHAAIRESRGEPEVYPATPCWYCGDALGLTVSVYWVGQDASEIWLHGGCASRLAAHLLCDAELARLGVADIS